MRKILLLILSGWLIASLAFPSFALATNYFGCQTGQALNGDNTWCAYADLESISPAACTKAAAGAYTAWATIAAEGASANLYANGCAEITLPDTDITVGKISSADAGTGANDFAGGLFTIATGTVAGNTYTFAIEAGTTYGLSISGNGAGTPVNTFIGSVTAGDTLNARGINSTHTVGTIAIIGDVTAGTATGTYGFVNGGATGLATVTGSCIAVGAISGCYASGAEITIVGNIKNATSTGGAIGKIQWNPGASNYLKYYNGAAYVYASQAPSIAKVISDTSVVVSTTGAYSAGTYHEATEAEVQSGVNFGAASALTGTYTGSGGGGAWGF